MIKARVTVETAKKTYKPGDIINEPLSTADMTFLRKHKFIVDVPESNLPEKIMMPESGGNMNGNVTEMPGNDGSMADNVTEMDENDSNVDDNVTGMPENDSNSGIIYIDEATLKKMKKDEIVEYAKSVGLILDTNALKDDMVTSVLNYIEEKMVS